MHELSSVRSTPGVGSEHSREVSESRVMSMSTEERITKGRNCLVNPQTADFMVQFAQCMYHALITELLE